MSRHHTATQPVLRRYASERMERRQEEILAAAREMLAEPDGAIRMRELAERSGVALGTLYNRFGSKERIAIEAVLDVFRNRLLAWDQTHGRDITDRLIERIAATVAEIRRRPAFARTMVACYFGIIASCQAGIAELLHTYPVGEISKALDELRRMGALRRDADIAEIAEEIVLAQYAAIAHWAKGQLDDDRLEQRLRRAVFHHLSAWLETGWAERLHLRARLGG